MYKTLQHRDAGRCTCRKIFFDSCGPQTILPSLKITKLKRRPKIEKINAKLKRHQIKGIYSKIFSDVC